MGIYHAYDGGWAKVQKQYPNLTWHTFHYWLRDPKILELPEGRQRRPGGGRKTHFPAMYEDHIASDVITQRRSGKSVGLSKLRDLGVQHDHVLRRENPSLGKNVPSSFRFTDMDQRAHKS